MALKRAHYPCPVCLSQSTRPRYSVSTFAIVQCVSCGMVYVDPRVCNEDIFSIYRDEYFHRGKESGYENYELTASLRIKTFGKWYADLEPFLPSRRENALDIGCAAGYFLDLLKEKGWGRINGIELDTRMLSDLKAKGFAVYDQPLELFTPERRYHLITLFDVLEHLPDINNDFAKLSGMLEDNGIIALVTPDFGSFQRKLFGARWFQFKPQEHIYYFSATTLRTIAHNHGFEVLHLASCGQYADFNFLHNRLAKYHFPVLNTLFSTACALTGSTKKFWYMDTGSIFAVLRKKSP